jgi:HAD superfamily hydrolase (TIGR01509 family)
LRPCLRSAEGDVGIVADPIVEVVVCVSMVILFLRVGIFEETMPKAILFDLGDTVLEEQAYNLVQGFEAISKHLASNVTFKNMKKASETFQSNTSEFQLLQWLDEHLAEDGVSCAAEEVELILWKNTVSLVPINGVRSVLEFLLENDIRIAAISNAIFSSSCMKYELRKHGLGDYFEFVLSSADLGIRKPDPRIFEFALQTLKLEPEEVWYVGDKWEADVVGSHAAQMTPV